MIAWIDAIASISRTYHITKSHDSNMDKLNRWTDAQDAQDGHDGHDGKVSSISPLYNTHF